MARHFFNSRVVEANLDLPESNLLVAAWSGVKKKRPKSNIRAVNIRFVNQVLK